MSFSIYGNTYRNLHNNVNPIDNKNPHFSPPISTQLNSAGRIATTPINYHYLQKEKEKEKEKEIVSKIYNQEQINNQINKNSSSNSYIMNFKPNSFSNVRNYESNKVNNDISNHNNKNSENIKDNHQNNFIRRNYHNNNYLSRNNHQNKEVKLEYNLIRQKEEEKEKAQKAKNLMDKFDKKLYDTISNFAPLNNNEKSNESVHFKEFPKMPISNYNLNSNFKKRNFSYDKFNINNYNYNNQNNSQNYHQLSTLRNTDTLYKNYFGNNNINIHSIQQNDNINNHNNICLNYQNDNNNGRDNYYRNQKNSMDKIISNKYQTINANKKEQNIEEFNKINQPKTKYFLKKYSSYSLGGTDAFKRPKTNQDSYLTKEDSKNYIFGVFDGHGFEGHLVSQAIKNYLNNNINSSTFSSKENINSIFNNLSSSINSSTTFNSMESGSTVVLTFISNNNIICANCGDSRAILITEKENNTIIPLSRDHKPELPEEKKRILEYGGRVDKIYGIGPFRVWFKDAEYPGLAMSRSIGDGYAHKVGVIDIPEIFEFNIEDVKPKAIILGSDGVFEFMKNEEIKEIIAKYLFSMDSQGCAKEIVENSRKIWENSGYAVDDITCVVGFFESCNQ